MIIINKNEGTKIPYEVDGTRVTFDDDLSINLAKREQDWPVHIDVCSDEDGALVVGAESGRRYVAQLDIPAATYTETVSDDETVRTKQPIDMSKVTLTLWSVGNGGNNG